MRYLNFRSHPNELITPEGRRLTPEEVSKKWSIIGTVCA